MTVPDLPDHVDLPDDPLDELASRYVDGDLDPADRARAEADAEVMRRVDRLRRVITLVASVEQLSGADVDRLVTAALAAADDAAVESSGRTAQVVSLRRRQRLLAWAGGAVAAAAVALVAVGVGPRLGGDTNDDAAMAPVANDPAVASFSADPDEKNGAESAELSTASGGLANDSRRADEVPAETPEAPGMTALATPEIGAPTDVTGPVTVTSADDLRAYLTAYALPQLGTCTTAPGTSAHGMVQFDGQTYEVIYDAAADTIELRDPTTCDVALVVSRLP
jgi:hypothetical protein